MNYIELKNELFNKQDPNYASFSKKISNSDYLCIGIKIPQLRQIIKAHKEDEDLLVSDFELGKYLEIDFLYFSLCLVRKETLAEQLSFLIEEIKQAKSWIITDSIPSFLKKCTFEPFYSFYQSMSKSSYVYDRRMAYVLALKFYKDKQILKLLLHMKPDKEYMVMMSQAWLLSTIAISFPDEVYQYLYDCKDLILKRKTISKIQDSYRFSFETKQKFKSLR